MRQDLDAEAWADALKLYERLSTFVGVAPREHDEWWLDVGAIMRLETRDPRAWESIDPYEGEEERREDPLFPWLETPSTPADAERHLPRVRELPRPRCGRWSCCWEYSVWTSPRPGAGRNADRRWNAGLT